MLDIVAGRVFLHPASVNFSCGSFPSGWLVYTDIVETSKASCQPSALGCKYCPACTQRRCSPDGSLFQPRLPPCLWERSQRMCLYKA